MKYLFLTVLLSIFWTPLAAQTDSLAEATAPMTLNDCMTYAVEHSPAVRQQDYTNANYRQDYIESVAALVPSLDASVGASTTFGRNTDPQTNNYTTTSYFNNPYSVEGQLPVFAGFSGINTLRAAKVMRLLGVEELQRVRDEVALKAMQAFFDVVYYTESVRLSGEQLAASTANLAKGQKLLELGLKSAADVAGLEAQVASDDYLLTQQENNLALSRITLCATMNYPADKPLEIDTNVTIDTPAGSTPLGDVLSHALDSHPRAEAAAYDVRHSELGYTIAKGRMYPRIYAGGGFSSNFFKDIGAWNANSTFGSQFLDNRGYYFSASLSIPIFGGLTRRTAMNRARNNMHIAEQRREQVMLDLQSEVAQAYQQMLGSGKEFVQASKKTAATELSYQAVAGKFERGMVSSLDLQTAANNLLQARSERLRSRLQYIVKSRLVEYYNGAPLIR